MRRESRALVSPSWWRCVPRVGPWTEAQASRVGAGEQRHKGRAAGQGGEVPPRARWVDHTSSSSSHAHPITPPTHTPSHFPFVFIEEDLLEELEEEEEVLDEEEGGGEGGEEVGDDSLVQLADEGEKEEDGKPEVTTSKQPTPVWVIVCVCVCVCVTVYCLTPPLFPATIDWSVPQPSASVQTTANSLSVSSDKTATDEGEQTKKPVSVAAVFNDDVTTYTHVHVWIT